MFENTVNPSSSKQLYRQDLGLYIKDSGIYWNVFHLRWTCRLMKEETVQPTQQRIIRYRRGCCCCCCVVVVVVVVVAVVVLANLVYTHLAPPSCYILRIVPGPCWFAAEHSTV